MSSTVTIVLVDETDACQNASLNSPATTTTTKTVTSSTLNPTRVNTTATTMLLHNNSLKYVLEFFYVHIELLLFVKRVTKCDTFLFYF